MGAVGAVGACPAAEDHQDGAAHAGSHRRPCNARKIRSLRDLARKGINFVNRQPGSGTRLLLDELLRSEGIEPPRIHGYDRGEFTHAAVAAFVASGMASASNRQRTSSSSTSCRSSRSAIC